MRRRLPCALVLLLALAPGAAARPLAPVGTTTGRPFSDGRRLVWQGAAGTALVVSDGVPLQRPRIATGPGWRLVDVALSARALVRCPTRTLVIPTAVRAAPTEVLIGPDVSLTRLGGVWAQGTRNGGCYHCDEDVLVRWRTGETRPAAAGPRPDLDDPGLHPLPRGFAARDDRDVVVRSANGRRLRTLERSILSPLARCHPRCVSVSIRHDRVAWIDHPAHGAGTLREVVLGSGRRRSWPLRGLGTGARRAIALRIRDRLFVAVRRASPRGSYRLYRAA